MAKNGLLKMVKNGLLPSYILSYINIFKIDQRSSFQGNNSWSFFLAKYVQGGKGAMKLTLYVKHQPVKQGQTATPGTPCPTLYDKWVL